MKITIVLGPFQPLPPAGFGAVEKVWMELGRGFARRGHEVRVIGRGAGDTDPAGPPGLRVERLAGFDPTGHIAVDLAKDFAYALRVAAAIPRSDIVVTNTFWLPVVLSPLKALKGRIVVHVARFPKGQMGLYRFCDSIQAISGAVARAITSQCPAVKEQVAVVGYPIDTEVYRPPPGGHGAVAGPLLLYVGRVHPEKGLHLLVEAFRRVVARIPSARLKIVGPAGERQGGGGEAYAGALRAAAAGLQVEFAGAIADEAALASEYRRADCFCYPSIAEKGEAFGRAVLEAMAAGLPCVVSDLECFRDFLAHGTDGIVFDHRAADPVQGLADALCAVLSDNGRAAELGEGARRSAERFSSDRITDAYLALFARVAGSGAVHDA